LVKLITKLQLIMYNGLLLHIIEFDGKDAKHTTC